MNGRRALQEGVHHREDDREEAPAEPSSLGVAIGFLRALSLAVWVRLVGGATWGVAGFHVGVALDAAGVPVVGTARAAAQALPVPVSLGTTGAAALLGTALFALGALRTLRWDDSVTTHRRRLLTLVLLAVLPVVLSAVEMVAVGVADALLATTVSVPAGPARAFYHVAATLAIAYGAAVLWHYRHTEREHGRWHTYD